MVGELVMDRFRVLERIGSGGMGTVYRAFDERLQREVAVKEITGGEAGRVLREAQAAARLNHPGIVTLYELGVDDGRALLVSELVEGATLAELAARGELCDRDVAELGSDACDALAHAHARGVVHRDIKPHNIIVRADDEGTRAKLMDFGIAALTGAASLTASGEVVGTLAYMAPEQASGEGAGPEADTYSLALTLYECWAGANPVRRDSPAATARAIGQPLLPLRSHRPDLPPDLGDAIDACLDPDPGLRPDLVALRGALEARLTALDAERPVPMPENRLSAESRPASARSAALAAAAGLALGLLGAGGHPQLAATLGVAAGALAALLQLGARATVAALVGAAATALLAGDPAGLAAAGLLTLTATTLAPVLRLGHVALALLAALLWSAGLEGLLRLAGAPGVAGPPQLVAALALVAVVFEFRARERPEAQPATGFGRRRPELRRSVA